MESSSIEMDNLEAIETLSGALRLHCSTCERPERQKFTQADFSNPNNNPCSCDHVEVMQVFVDSLKHYQAGQA